MRNLQEQIKKALCYQKFLCLFNVWINCSSDLKTFSNSQPSALNFKSFSRSLEHFFLTGQNNFGNKIPFLQQPPIFLILSYIFSNSLRGHRHPFPWWFHHCQGHRSHHRQLCQCWPLQSLVPKAPRDLQGFLSIILLEMNEQKKIAAVVQLQFR